MKPAKKNSTSKASKASAKPTAATTVSKHKHYQEGAWILRPRKSEVHTCRCGNRYLKTRPQQSVCVRCLFGYK